MSRPCGWSRTWCNTFGTAAGLLAGLFLAVTPIAVAVDRSGNADSCLTLVLLLAAFTLVHAAERGSLACLALSTALVGLAFNVKMLAAFVVVPTFALVYWLGAPLSWRHRVGHLAVGAIVLAGVSASWVTFFDLTPPDRRPYAGTTDRNSMAELAVGPYGIGRFVKSREFRSAGDQDRARTASADATPLGPGSPRGSTIESRIFVRVPPGPLRLADGHLAAQFAWLAPFALIAVGGAQQTARTWPLAPAHLAPALWSGWALTYALVYSLAGGIFHFYYLSTMGPPLAALAGIGVVSGWQWARHGTARALVLPAALLVTAAWQIFVEFHALGLVFEAGHWRTWMRVALLAGALLSVGVLVAATRRQTDRSVTRHLAAGALAVGVAAALVNPFAWARSTVLVKGIAAVPSTDLSRLVSTDVADAILRARLAGPATIDQLAAFLRAHRQGERFLLATQTTRLAAPLIIQTGEPVMAMGGFHGLDPILTPDRLAELARTKQVRFVMLGDLSRTSRRLGAERASQPVADWVRANGARVDPALWRAPGDGASGMQLYDLSRGT